MSQVKYDVIMVLVMSQNFDYDVTIAEIRRSIFEFREAISQVPNGILRKFFLFQVRNGTMHLRR